MVCTAALLGLSEALVAESNLYVSRPPSSISRARVEERNGEQQNQLYHGFPRPVCLPACSYCSTHPASPWLGSNLSTCDEERACEGAVANFRIAPVGLIRMRTGVALFPETAGNGFDHTLRSYGRNDLCKPEAGGVKQGGDFSPGAFSSARHYQHVEIEKFAEAIRGNRF